MERERPPDREGYLEYCRRVEAGDRHLSARAYEEAENNRATELAQYYHMRRVERAIDNALTDSIHTIVQGYEMTSFQMLKNTDIRTAALDEMMDVAKAWDVERFRNSLGHVEFHKSVDFRYATTELRHENPSRPEGQAWFKAKQETERLYLARLIADRKSLDRRLDQISLRAQKKDRAQGSRERGGKSAPQLGDPGYAEYRDQQRGKDRGGRER